MASTFEAYRRNLLAFPALGFALDLSRAEVPAATAARLAPAMARAFADMAALEQGAVANPDEKRMVGHYWLRTPELAPDPALGAAVRASVDTIEAFAARVHAGQVRGTTGAFTDLLCIGIGGSALGPQFVTDALGGKADKLRVHFIDNTDPDGIDRVFDTLSGRLGTTLAIVTSKSGSTPEPRNGQIEAAHRWQD